MVPLQGCLEHFLKGRSSGHEIPQPLFTWECLIYPSLFKDIFADTGFLVNTFSLSTSNMSAPCFQTSRISDEKSADDLIQSIVCGDSCLACCF